MAAHAILSPSASHRWIACPGSVKANRDAPYTTNAYAQEGTAAHALLELALTLDSDPSVFEGQTLGPGLPPVDEDMIYGVGYAIDYVKAFVANNPGAKIACERQVAFGAQVGTTDDIAFGTLDVSITTDDEAVVIDYKHGQGVSVSVHENAQLRMYMLGLRAEKRYQRYRGVIVQPRVRGRRPVQESTLTDKQLTDWAKKTVVPIVPVALSEDAPRRAGAHCRWCHADGNCRAQYDMVQAAASKEFK